MPFLTVSIFFLLRFFWFSNSLFFFFALCCRPRLIASYPTFKYFCSFNSKQYLEVTTPLTGLPPLDLFSILTHFSLLLHHFYFPTRRFLEIQSQVLPRTGVMPWPVLQLTGHLLFPVAPRSFATSNYGCDQIPKHYMQTYKPRRFNIIPNHLSTPAQPNGSLQRFNIMPKHLSTSTTSRSQTPDLHLCHLVSNVHPTRSPTSSQSRRLGHLQPTSSIVTGGSAGVCTTSHY